MKCDWFIIVLEGNIVKFYFDSFGLDWSLGCIGDYLEVIDGNNSNSKSIGRFCGFGLYVYLEFICLSGRYMLVCFRLDWLFGGYDDGFKVIFIVEDESSELELFVFFDL